MCEECDYDPTEPVSLIRQYPKNKVTPDTTPAEYLEGHDIARGLYDLIDKMEVRRDEEDWRSQVVGYYTEYRGTRYREYSQPMFTFKVVQDECSGCEQGNEPDFHLPRKYASNGCNCGNIAYVDRDCPDHPLPSVDSRWVRVNQARNSFCQHCDRELSQEIWDRALLWYCNAYCKTQAEIAHKKRMAELDKRYRNV